jgi:hypothetical protein
MNVHVLRLGTLGGSTGGDETCNFDESRLCVATLTE